MRILKTFILFLSFYFLTIFLLPNYSYACCSNAECNGATCAGAGAGCPQQNNGTCTGGGTECGFSQNCPVGYTCTNGNCINNSGGGACPCGVNQQGGCKPCGGGGTPPTCPAGTAKMCGSPATYRCVEVFSTETSYCPFPKELKSRASMRGKCNGNIAPEWCRWNCACCPIGSSYVNGIGCTPSCSATAPTAISFNSAANTISWTSGTGGTSQKLYVGTSQAVVEANCVGTPACVINSTTAVSPYSTTGLLTPLTTYYVRVVNSNGATCNANSATYNFTTPAPTCTVNVSASTGPVGSQVIIGASIPTSNGVITQVNFTSSNLAVATVTSPDTTASYTTTATTLSAGTTNITADVVMSGAVRCTGFGVLTVTNLPEWWQVKDGDVTAGTGNITSIVPTGQLFDIVGSGGFPGVPVYGGSLSVNPGGNSTTNWNADTLTTLGRIFDYNYFESLIPDSVTPTSVSGTTTLSGTGANLDGYEIYKASGNLQINATNLGNRKVILLVDNNGNLTINGAITVNDNVGFFGAFVDGNIVVNGAVTGAPSLEGIYLSDGTFSSGVGNTRLHVRGSVAGIGGINLQRDLSNNSTAAELFEYAPDQILLFPKKFGYRRTKWAEIAP